MFINFSNHPSTKWNQEQLNAAGIYGKIVDIPFPVVVANVDTLEIQRLAEEYIVKISDMHPDCVMCQGEFTLTFAVVKGLKLRGICCVSACSDRVSREIHKEDGSIEKTSVIEFCQFREYA